MKRVSKKITLKKDTLFDIESNNIDTDIYIERIKEYLNKANYLIKNKIIDMNSIELYKALNEVFNIYFEPRDYLKILSLMNNKHYSRFLMINTKMYDENDYNVTYLCAATNQADCLNNDTLNLKKLRKLTESNELVLLKPNYIKKDKKDDNEKFESHLNNYVNIHNKVIDENNPLFPFAALLLKKDLIIKNVLYDLKLYCDELTHQIREINGLAFLDETNPLTKIGKQYKKAYDKATNDCILPKKEKVSVRYHQKVKNKK